MPQGFLWLMAAHFFSALADNALLIVTMALLQQQGQPIWWAPLLKLGFNLSYVVLAPVVGPLADAFPKARLMAWMNGVKVMGLLAMLAGLHPVAAFAVIGFGAAAYAPAKYGLVTELVKTQYLVRANGWIEVTIVCAILLGTVLGGLLISPLMLDDQKGFGPFILQGSALAQPLVWLLAVYALAGVMNLGVPHSPVRSSASRAGFTDLMKRFVLDNRRLWTDPQGGLSLAVTTLFWGVGAALQFAVLRWAMERLGLDLSQAAYLQAAVAVGVVLGAAVAGYCIPLAGATSVLWAGVVLGLLMAVVSSTTSLLVAIPLLVLVGAVGGLLVVPMNALLQHRGHALLTSGRSIAVQGFNENASVLFVLAIYALLSYWGLAIVPLMWGLGVSVAVGVGLLIWGQRRHSIQMATALATKSAPK